MTDDRKDQVGQRQRIEAVQEDMDRYYNLWSVNLRVIPRIVNSHILLVDPRPWPPSNAPLLTLISRGARSLHASISV